MPRVRGRRARNYRAFLAKNDEGEYVGWMREGESEEEGISIGV